MHLKLVAKLSRGTVYAVYAVYTVYTVYTVYAVYTVYTVYTVYKVYKLAHYVISLYCYVAACETDYGELGIPASM